MRKRLAMSIIVIGMLLTPGIGAAEQVRADQLGPFSVSGRCDFFGAGVLVDFDRAQALVPLPVLDVGGRALVGLVAMDCESSLEGGPVVSSTVTVAGVFTDPVRSPYGCQFYDFHWAEDVEGPWVDVFTRVGQAVEVQPDSRLTSRLGGVVAEVTGERAPWSMEAVTERIEPPTKLVTVHCHVGDQGLVIGTYDHDGPLFTPAPGRLVLGEGPLWDALGAEAGPVAPGLSAAFTYTAVIEVVS